MKSIKCYNLTKSFGKTKVLKNFNCEITSEKINFLQGSNGTGKSTFIRCILDFLKYKGVIVRNFKKCVIQPEKVVLPDYFKVNEYLKIINKIHHQNSNNPKMELLIKKFGLEGAKKQDIITLSKGMRQKVLLIQTLMIEADCYIFDEPLNGLDKESQNSFMKELKELRDNQKIIIITTHFPTQYPFRKKQVIDFNQKEQYEYDKIAPKIFIK